MTPAQAIAQFAPIGDRPHIVRALHTLLNPNDSALVQSAIYQALLAPSHNAALVEVNSPLGRLWQTHTIVKATGQRIDRNYPNLSETIEYGETPLQAAVRGLKEELGLEISPDRLTLVQVDRLEVKHSKSEDRLKRYLFQVYSVTLTQLEAEATQLEADEEDTIVYFDWRQS